MLCRYSEALTYPPTQEEAAVKLSMVGIRPIFFRVFLSSGVYEVTLLPSFRRELQQETQRGL